MICNTGGIIKISKRLMPLLLSICMMFIIGTQSAAAVVMNEKMKENGAVVPALEYQSVADKIAIAQEKSTVRIGAETVHYYWSENSFVAQDSNGYYYVEINEDFTQFNVNGKAYDITRISNNTGVPIPNDVSYPTEWSTIYDETFTFDVGELPPSIIAGLVSSVLTGLTKNPYISIAIGAIAESVTAVLIDGLFPTDYVLTVKFYKEIRMLGPIEMEHFDKISIYGGPSSSPYKTTFYFGSEPYVKEYPE